MWNLLLHCTNYLYLCFWRVYEHHGCVAYWQANARQLCGGKVPVVCAVIESVTARGVDAGVSLRDPTGNISPLFHRGNRFHRTAPHGILVNIFLEMLRNRHVSPSSLGSVYSKSCWELLSPTMVHWWHQEAAKKAPTFSWAVNREFTMLTGIFLELLKRITCSLLLDCCAPSCTVHSADNLLHACIICRSESGPNF